MARLPRLPYIADVTSALYNRDILRLASAIPHLGRLPAAQARAERSSPACGSRVSVELDLGPDGRVAAFAQEVRACALGQAAAALMGAHAVGCRAAELAAAHDALVAYLAGRREDPGDWPGLAVLAPVRPYPGRHAAVLLPFAAVAEAAAQAAREAA